MLAVCRFALLPSVVILLFLAAAGEARARNRAILVGVSEYENKAIQTLMAPGRDVKRVWDLLSERGFQPDDMAVLANSADKTALAGLPAAKIQAPTAANILKALDDTIATLRRSSEPGREFVVFYFSGHGTYHEEKRANKSSDIAPEADGNDEALLASDAGTFDEKQGRIPGSVLDDDLKARLEQLQRLAFVWVIIDSCHAGGTTRGASDEVVYKSIDPETLKAPKADPAAFPSETAKPSDWIPDSGSRALVSFLAVNEDAKAIERNLTVDGGTARASVFTHFLVTAMRQTGLTTYRQLANEVQSLIARDAASNPAPMFLGDLDRPLDGGAVTWSVEVSNGTVSVNAGGLAGIAKDAVLALKRQENGREQVVGYGKVVEAGAVRSRLEPIDFRGAPKPALSALERGVTASVAMAVVSFELTVAKPRPGACHETTKGLSNSRRVETDAEKAAYKRSREMLDAAVRRLSDKSAAGFPVRFVEPGQAALVRLCLASDVVYYVGADGALDFGPRRATPGRKVEGTAASLADGLSEDLWRIARQQNLLRVAGETARSPIGQDVEVKLRLVRGEPGTSASGDPEKRACEEFARLPAERAGRELRQANAKAAGNRGDGTFVTFDDRISHCDRIVVEIRNASEHDVDITLLYLDSTGGIGRVSAVPDARIPKGRVRESQTHIIKIVTWCPSGDWAACREAERKSARADTYATVGTERLAVIIAEASGPSRVYDYLAQPGVNRAPERTRGGERNGDSFDALLRDAAMTGAVATRGVDAAGDAAIKVFQWEVVPPADLKQARR